MQDPEDPSDRSDPASAQGAAAASGALLAEVDHRVKNNLQLVASMILLQHRRTEDEAARRALKGVLERVNAVATVHRRLFQGDPHRFDVDDFMRDLTSDLAASAGRDDLQITLDLKPVVLPASSAAAFALVAAELLGNALRHAYPPGRGGPIAVSLGEGQGVCTLTIADRGIGVGAAPTGFGLTIAGLLAKQLHARLEVTPGDPSSGGEGTRATLTVPMQPEGAG
ncbi:MAG: sensor histidine kinase [Caulobacteraceae bacterium]